MHHLTPRLSPRATGRSVALWLFGLSTTLLLIGLWGRSVTGDEVTLEESARTVLESELVNQRMTDWATEAVAEVGSATPGATSALIEDIMRSPELELAIDAMVDQTVEAALAPPDRPSTLDLTTAVDRLRPAVERTLATSGLPLDPDVVLSAFEDFVFSSNDMDLASTTVAEARSLLTKVVLLGIAGMMLTGAVAVVTTDDRMAQLRSLSWRVALSSFTFGLMLRIGSWAVDPAGGRSPIAAGSSVVLGSNGHIPVIMTTVFAAIGSAASILVVRRRRRRMAQEHTGEQPVLVGVG